MEPEIIGIELDVSTHEYRFNGRRIAGVTEILSGLGLVDARWFTEYSRERGGAVHRAAELLVKGQLDWATVDERIRGYVEACAKFLDEASVAIGSPAILSEHLVYSRTYGYAGKLDLAAPLFKSDELSIVDYKSGGVGKTVGMQLAAYEDPMREELALRKPLRRFACRLSADKTYKLTEYKDRRDAELFRAAALIYNEFYFGKTRKDEQP